MRAVILVGGEGMRLRPLTCNVPKPMVPILNKPFLEHMVRYLAGHGIRDIILAMGYLPDQIRSYFGDGTTFGVNMTYLIEEYPLGTAGAVKHAEDFLDGPFLVFNGDVLTEIDLTDMMEQHREVKPTVSIALTPVEDPTIYGVVETDSSGVVGRFVEKPSWDRVTTNMINAGIYILDPEVLEHIPQAAKSMFEHHVFPALLEKGRNILAYPSTAYWIDIGTPEKYLQANHDLLSVWDNDEQPVRIEGEVSIDSTAIVEGPVIIGDGCVVGREVRVKGPAVLGPDCEVGDGAVIEGAVVWHNVKVGRKSYLKNCVVCSRSRILDASQVLDGCVVGDSVSVDGGEILAPGVALWPEA